MTRWWTANGQDIEAEAEHTDHSYPPDDDIVILFQRPVVCLGETLADLLAGVGLVEL